MDTFCAQRLTKLLLQGFIDGLDDEIHDLNRGIDNAQHLRRARERITEELVVEFHDEVLARLRVGDAGGAATNRGIEALQPFSFAADLRLIND